MTDDGVLGSFFDTLPFPPDPFQTEALEAFVGGSSVVVTAPTGAGKTLVADGAVYVTIARGSRAFYTTPIKALSNQKFADLRAVHGAEKVGLLTGDNVVNGDAPIVVMTTEVLRNMIYEESDALERLGVVILDEVHYLADRQRGSVWEEVIIHLDRAIPLVCLSATVANPEEFSSWVRSRRGRTELIVERSRPVPLTSTYMWRDRHHGGRVDMLPIFARNGRPNPTITKLTRSKGRFRRLATPHRTDVVERLADERLLPAIVFLFSRKGCDQTAERIAASDLTLTTADERTRIRRIAERHTGHVSDEDLRVLGYDRWLSTLERGAAAHHAGLVPAFKETVEELFLEGLVKVVAATETLALGINMPARTVVLDSLSKFTGEGHELLTPSDYTQLTGRAGRRGIDTEGTAVVLYSSHVPFDRVASIAATGANPLRSSFAPTYNMTVNLMARYDEVTAHGLLAASFANFASAHRNLALTANLEERRRDLEAFREAAHCDRGDIFALGEAHDQGPSPSVRTDLLEPGTVIDIGGTRSVLLGRSWGGTQPQLDLTDASAQRRRVRTRDLSSDVVVIGTMRLPEPIRGSDAVYRSEIAAMLESFVEHDRVPLFDLGDVAGPAACPDIGDHLRWVRRARRAERDIRRLERRIERQADDDVAREFDRLRTVLGRRGYVHGWELTEKGARLRSLYNELDLLLTESVDHGAFAHLDAAAFASIVSLFTYETRGGDVPHMPTAAFAGEPIETVLDIWEDLAEAESAAGVDPTRPPDFGLVDPLYGWAMGLDLDEIFDREDVGAGDFVRSVRQVLDLLRQIRDAYPELRQVASEATRRVDRGIVSAEVPS